MRLIMTGRTASDETKQKIRNAKLGIVASNETKNERIQIKIFSIEK
jgi:hypothetical protein